MVLHGIPTNVPRGKYDSPLCRYDSFLLQMRKVRCGCVWVQILRKVPPPIALGSSVFLAVKKCLRPGNLSGKEFNWLRICRLYEHGICICSVSGKASGSFDSWWKVKQEQGVTRREWEQEREEGGARLFKQPDLARLSKKSLITTVRAPNGS